MNESTDASFEVLLGELKQANHRYDLRRSLNYLKLLLGDIDQFEQRLADQLSQEDARDGFQRLMTLTLGSSGSWERLHAVSGKLGFSLSAVERYVMRKSAPIAYMYPFVLKVVREVLTEEYMEIEHVLTPLEQEEDRKREQYRSEWVAFRERVETVIPGNYLNCQVRFSFSAGEKGSDEIPFELLFAYPCRGIYELDEHNPSICRVCAEHGKEQSHTHGRVFLSSEDGLLLLPQIVRSQADLLQVLKDIGSANENNGMFAIPNQIKWLEACTGFLEADPIVTSLPKGDSEKVELCDLNAEKLIWVMC
jgi:hypothetical protein